MNSSDDSVNLTECDKEPIHIPGSIQPHGVLIVTGVDDTIVRQISENCGAILGRSSANLLGSDVLDIIPEDTREEFSRHLAESVPRFSNPLRVPVEVNGEVVIFDGVTHEVDGDRVLELENPMAADVADGSRSRSMDLHFRFTQQALQAIQESETVAGAAEAICTQVRDYTGFDRVMVYRFAPDFHGEVIGEACREDLEAFLGLHYPATDVPRQARELYKRNWIRLIHDVGAETVSLAPADRVLDMSDCGLRSVSPIHIQYLKNMGVSASMSISLLDGDDLWGLIACHHYSGPKYVSYRSRISCVHFGLVVSSRIVTKENEILSADQSARRKKLIGMSNEFSHSTDLFQTLREHSEGILELTGADGIAIVREHDVVSHGTAPDREFVEELLLQIEKPENTVDWIVTSRLRDTMPGLSRYPSEAAGILVMSLGKGWQLIFFRKEERQNVRWAGKPEKSTDPKQALTPRNSFSEWLETVEHQAREWSETDLQLINELRTALMAFTIQQNIHLERLNRKLAAKTREVEQFAYSVSHDLKSPLVTVSGFVGALEEDIASGDSEAAADSLSRISRAAERMGILIEELLAFSRIGRHGGRKTKVDINSLFEELQMEFEQRLEDVGATLKVESGLPDVVGYRGDIFRVFHNFVSNSLEHRGETTDLTISITGERRPKSVRYSVVDNGPGIKPEYHERIFDLFQRIDVNTPGTGVGLASVAKIAEIHRGSCGVESTPGAGSTFWVEFPAEFKRRTTK